MTHIRLTADERRSEIIAAAKAEFATNGYAGTATDAIAKRAGISQPYLFRLFGTKRDLFLATVHACFQEVGARLESAACLAQAEASQPRQVLDRLSTSYIALLSTDRDLLRLQFQAFAAAGDPAIGPTVRHEFFALCQNAACVTGVDPRELRQLIALGMLTNAVGTLADTRTLDEFLALLG